MLAELTKRLLDRALDEELTDHLGYERRDSGDRVSGNNRNGTSAKTVSTEVGAVDLAVPRDRNANFEPKLVPKHARRLEGFNANIVHLYARGPSTRESAGSWPACAASRCLPSRSAGSPTESSTS